MLLLHPCYHPHNPHTTLHRLLLFSDFSLMNSKLLLHFNPLSPTSSSTFRRPLYAAAKPLFFTNYSTPTTYFRPTSLRTSGVCFSAHPIPAAAASILAVSLEGPSPTHSARLSLLLKKLEKLGIEGHKCTPGQHYNLLCPMEPDIETISYGLDDIKNSGVIIIAEGEIDKLAMEEAGYLNCVSVADGAPSIVSEKDVPPPDKVEQESQQFLQHEQATHGMV